MVCNIMRSRALAMATIGLFVLGLSGQSYGALQNDYYNKKCISSTTTSTGPNTTTTNNEVIDVEETVKAAMATAFQNDTSIVAALLRMQFHDCFVKGCDASILLDGVQSEKTAPPNLSVRGYEVIDSIKKEFESKCSQVVSCADIIVMATRDAVNFSSGGRVQYNVETGRLDGKESKATNVDLPSPKISVSSSVAAFAKKGLNITDMVLLLGGGHSVGVAHCSLFQDRLYNFKNSGKADPTMDPKLVTDLKQKCPQSSTGSNTVMLDQTPESSMVVDKEIYNQLLRRRGILDIDQQIAIPNDNKTQKVVLDLAQGTLDFNQKFGQAMVKLGRVGVITDLAMGEIRTSCRTTN